MLRTSIALSFLAVIASAAPPAKSDRIIKVPVWVDSADALSLNDMSATLEGAQTRILDVKGPGDDLMLLVVLDLASDLSLSEPAKEAVASAIETLPPNVFTGVLRAQDGPVVLADPGPDRAAAVKAVRDLPVSGKAGLLDTVETVTRLADSILAKSYIRVAVLYITDSDVENYREDYTNPVINSSDAHDLSRKFPEVLIQDKISKVAGVLAGRQTPLFIVHLRARSDRLGEAYQNGLKQLAEVTGGSAIFCRSSEEIAEAIRRAFRHITSSYCVTLALPDRASRNLLLQLSATGKGNLSYRTRFMLKER